MLTSSELDQAIAASWDRQLDWLKTLVGFPSQRGLEGPCQDWIAAAFRTRGWSVDRYVLSDVDMEHLPGHSPGSIGLFEAATKTLFSGDAIYDGPLLDELPGSDIASYRRTIKRLRDMEVAVVHGGHDPSFGRERMIEICDGWLALRA